MQSDQITAELKKQTIRIEKRIGQFLDYILETDNHTVRAAYEKKIAGLENEKLILAEKLENQVKPAGSFDQLFKLSLAFLKNPWYLWACGNIKLQRIVLRLAFTDRIAYHPEKGCLNPKKSFPFKALNSFFDGKEKVVGSRGLISNHFEGFVEEFDRWNDIMKDTSFDLDPPSID